MNLPLYQMSDDFPYRPCTKSYLISGQRIKRMRQKFNIGFMEYTRRSTLSTRTLASIESSNLKVVKEDTMIKIMRGFNVNKNGTRKKRPLNVDKVADCEYTVRNPIIADVMSSTPKKITVYLNRATHRWVQTYAKKYWVSENKAIVQAIRSQFNLVEDEREVTRYTSTFDIIGNGSLG